MILLYHNISLTENSGINYKFSCFIKDMLHLTRMHIVPLSQYNPKNDDEIVITFDDGYRSVLDYAAPVLKFLKFPFEVFVCGHFVELGEQDNCWYCNIEDLKQLKAAGGNIQYHSFNHKNLAQIEDIKTLKKEIICPQWLKIFKKDDMKFFAYPYYSYNDKTLKIVKESYLGALSGKEYGNNNTYSLNRNTIEETQLKIGGGGNKLSIIEKIIFYKFILINIKLYLTLKLKSILSIKKISRRKAKLDAKKTKTILKNIY